MYADTNFGVNLATTAKPYPNPAVVAAGRSLDLGDLKYDGPLPPPLPAGLGDRYPDHLRSRPATGPTARSSR